MWEQQSGGRRRGSGSVIYLIAVLLCASGCPQNTRTPTAPTLFSRVGGVDGLRPVVDELVGRIAADELIAPSLVATDFELLKKQLLLFLCARSGGDCLEGGERPLIPLASGTNLDAATGRLIELAFAAAQSRQVAEAESRELSQLIALDSKSIIGRPR